MIIENIINELQRKKVSIKVKEGNIILSGKTKQLSAEVITSIRENKSQIISYLNKNSLAEDDKLNRANSEDEYYRLSYQQELIWLSLRKQGMERLYNQPAMFEINGNINYERLQKAVGDIIANNSILRTGIYEIDGVPYQKACNEYEYTADFINVNNDEELYGEYNKISSLVFNMEKPPLFKCALVQNNNGRQYLLFNIHHIISDGWSVTLFISELFSYYNKHKDNAVYPLVEKADYRQYVASQTDYLNSERYANDKVFWEELINRDYKKTLVTSKSDVKGNEYHKGGYKNYELVENMPQKIVEYCKKKKITPYNLYTAAICLLLKKYTGNDKIVYGAPFACRNSEAYNNTIGCFVNTLPVITDISDAATIDDVISAAGMAVMNSYEHQEYPAKLLIENIREKQGSVENPLYDIIITYQNYSVNYYDKEGIELRYINTPNEYSKSALVFRIFEEQNITTLNIEYSVKYFDEHFIDRMFTHLNKILVQIIKNHNENINQIEYIPDNEKEVLINSLNNTGVDYSKEKTVVDYINEQFKNRAGDIAVISGNKSITYSELELLSGNAAKYLADKNIRSQENIIAIMTEKNENLIVSILAVLRIGAAYLPINPEYPEARIRMILDDSKCKTIITDSDTNYQGIKTIRIQAAVKTNAKGTNKYEEVKIKQNDLAYVIYTSGTSGKPKGVAVNHKNLLRLFINDNQLYDFNETDVWTLFHSYSFDFSVWEIFGALLFGGKLIIVGNDSVKDPDKYLRIISEKKVTILNQTPSAFFRIPFYDNILPSLRYIIFGGEALYPDRLKGMLHLFPNAKIINMYGITETTVHVTYKQITVKEINEGISNIGKPIPTMGICVLDKNNKILPIGIEGQICVYGEGLSSGYLGRNELTAEKFRYIAPFGLCYMSGDYGRVLETGDIEYIGRFDQQVQYHGFRIELSEIENALCGIDGIKEAAVISEEIKGNITLIAFIVSDKYKNGDAVRKELSKALPDYMLPSEYQFIENVPLTINGKADRKELLYFRKRVATKIFIPGTEQEDKILKAWKETLDVESIGENDSFFASGGDSIKALRLISNIKKNAGIQYSVADIYEYDTIRKMIENNKTISNEGNKDVIKESERLLNESDHLIRESNSDNIELILPMSDIQKGMVFYSLRDEAASVYHDQFVFQIYLPEFSLERMNKALNILVRKHSTLRTAFNMHEYGEEMQVVYKSIKTEITYSDLSEVETKMRETTIDGRIREERNESYDMEAAPLWRMELFRTGMNSIVLLWSFHHSILDGWSNSLFITELLSTYKKLKANGNYYPHELNAAYLHYISEQNVFKKNEDVKNFWKEYLYDYKRMELPLRVKTLELNEVEEYCIRIEKELGHKIHKAAKEYRCGTKIIYMAAYFLCLNMLTYESDILAGVVTNNRPAVEDGEKILGCYLNTIPYRIKIDAEWTWSELIENLIILNNEIKKYEKLSLLEIIKYLELQTENSNPLFDVVFNYIDFNSYEELYSDYSLTAHNISEYNLQGYENTNTILNFTLSETLDILTLRITYNPDLVPKELIKRVSGYYMTILEKITSSGNNKINYDELLSEYDKGVIKEFNNTAKVFSYSKTYTEEFNNAVDKYPRRIAVVDGETMITYSELNSTADSLADLISEKDVKKNRIIALLVEHDINLFAGMMAILKAGCVVLPISVKTPRERIKDIITDSGAAVLITTSRALRKGNLSEKEIAEWKLDSIKLDNVNPGSVDPIIDRIKINKNANDEAYIVYTSGTTGKPKGIVYSHSSIMNMCAWFNDYYNITCDDRLTKYAEINYDANIWEIFPALLCGASIYIIPEEYKLDMPKMNKFFIRNKISAAWLPTPVLEQFVYEDNSSLRIITTGGDRLNKIPQKPYAIFNNYGPAENTVAATVYKVNHNEEVIPIGRPISNNEIFILKKNQLVMLPPGVTGEICIAGKSLAKGYLNDEELTRAKYILNKEGKRIYRTGDLGRINWDGNLEFLGRADRQIKIRGQRLEVEEIESVLTKYQGIKKAVVVGNESDSNVISLTAFTVKDKSGYNEKELQKYLTEKLPSYMLPEKIINVEKIPLTVTGKIDYARLKSNNITKALNKAPEQGEANEKLLKIWADVLKKEKTDIDNEKNFFEQGGNSISLIRIQRKIKEVFSMNIPITDLLKYTTLKRLSDYIVNNSSKDENKEYPLENERSIMQDEDIAVIGMACKIPGADNIYEYWENLNNGKESITFFNDKELERNRIPNVLIKDKNYVKAAGVINEPESFDADLFSYTENEASIMDPQIRVFYECAWSALEDGGYNPDEYNGRIGVFAGASKNTKWEECAYNYPETDSFSASLLSSKDNLATLISYKMNLKGPAVNIYTACSTSLTAIHEACKSLNAGDCEMAICGGVNIALPLIGGCMSGDGSVFSDDGHCRPFSRNGKGTVAGKGAAVVLLKKIKWAKEDGDSIYAVIKKSAINNDGYQKAGYTAPGIDGQYELLKSIYSEKSIRPESIGYIEAHGTGTELGDSIELEALKNVFGGSTGKIPIGSVKANIGHLDTAAGAASFIKAVLMLKERIVVPCPQNYAEETILDNTPFYLPKKSEVWNSNGKVRRAGVSSFGIGGTNVHIVLEEYIEPDNNSNNSNSKYHFIQISANSKSAFENNKNNIVEYLIRNKSYDINDIEYSLKRCRKQYKHRNAYIGQDIEEIIEKMKSDDSCYESEGRTDIVFMFPGQGTQYVNMGRYLYSTQPEYKYWFDKCSEILNELSNDIDIKKILYPSSDKNNRNAISETTAAHCSLFVFEYALSKLFISLDIKPSSMIGHSLGEYAAACLSGVLSLHDALKLVLARGEMVKKAPGKMLSVNVEENRLYGLVDEFNKGEYRVYIASYNSDSNFIISGDNESIESFNKRLISQSIESKVLHIEFASHCGIMENAIDDFSKACDKTNNGLSEIKFITNKECEIIEKGDTLNASYWSSQITNPVYFAKGMEKILTQNRKTILIEIGPGTTLLTYVNNISALNGKVIPVSVIPHPKEETDPEKYFMEKIAVMWRAGLNINWKKYDGEGKRKKLHLPTYCFDKRIFPISKVVDKYEDNKTVPASLYYVEQWAQSELLPQEKYKDRKIVLIADDYGVADILHQRMNGEEIVRVNNGGKYCKNSKNDYIVNSAVLEHYNRLINELKNDNLYPTDIIYLRGLKPCKKESYGKIIEEQTQGFINLAGIARYLADLFNHEIKITVAASNMFDVYGNEDISIAGQSIYSAIKVIPQEYMGIRTNLIEYEYNDLLKNKEYYCDKLIDEAALIERDNIYAEAVSYRNKKRWLRKIVNIENASPNNGRSNYIEHGVYIITGGAGKVGGVVASYLAKKYKASLIITGRTQVNNTDENNDTAKSEKQNRIIAFLKMLKSYGAAAEYMSADAGNYDSMDKVIKKAMEQYGRIDGIIHAAAATEDLSISLPLKDITVNELKKQYDVKVKGAFIIDKLAENNKIKNVVLISSTSSILGGIGFGAYAASNMIINAFARVKNREGKAKWQSLIWDGWYFKDYSADMKEAPRESTIKADEGENILSDIEALTSVDNLIISKRDINEEIKKWSGGIYNLNKREEEYSEQTKKQRPVLSAAYKKPVEENQKMLCELWEEFFGIDKIGVDDHFYELGGDSLKATFIVSKIHKRTGVKIPLAEFLKKPTIAGLSSYIDKSGKMEYEEIKKAESQLSYPLSSAQKRLFMVYRMDSGNMAYNIHSSAVLEGNLDKTKLLNAFYNLIDNNESLRTIFTLEGGKAVQKITDIKNIKTEIENVTEEKYFYRPFNLEEAPLIRMGIKKNSENSAVLLIDTHHIISDAFSMSLIFKELSKLYDGQMVALKRLQYKDYAVWQNTARTKTMIEKQKSFWLDTLSGELPVMNLPYDYKRPSVQKYEGGSVVIEIGKDETDKLKKAALQTDATLFMLLLAAYNVLLSKYSGQEDIIVGSPSSGRENDELKNVIGMFANTVVFRNEINGNVSLSEFITAVKRNALSAFDNQDYQFDEIVDELKNERDVSRNPIFDVMFVYINIDFSPVKMKGIKIKPYEIENNISRFDLTLHCSEEKEKIKLTFEYSTNLFKRRTIEKMAGHFNKIVNLITDNKDILIREITLTGDEEKEELLKYNKTQKKYDDQILTVPSLYIKQHAKNEDKTGIIFADGKPGICFNEYHRIVGKLTAEIIKSEAYIRGGLVGIIAERNEGMLYGVMSIIMSDNGYVAIDPSMPVERAAYIAEDSGCKIMLCQKKHSVFAGKIFHGKLIIIEDEIENEAHTAAASITEFPVVKEENPLFLLYTSGSTGKPKGVLMPHKPIINLILWLREEYPVENECILFLNPFTFDMSIWGLFAWAVNGTSVCVLKHGYERDPSKIVEAVLTKPVTTIHFVPSMLMLFLDYIVKNKIDMRGVKLKYVFVSGEILNKSMIYKFRECMKDTDAELVNFYGPTEAHVVTHFRTNELNEEEHLTVPIGKPIYNTKILIVDKEMKPVPQGVLGEVLLGGDCLADCYLNKEELTNEKFIIINNVLTGRQERFYRTGDIGRWLYDGNIEFLGRNDHQIKIRGYRVEPEEVQAIINKIRGVKENLIIVKEKAPGDKRLVAYIVYDEGEKYNEAFIRSEIKKQAADYMVPSAIIKIDKFPLNSNGKIERRLLPEPDFSNRNEIITPKNKTEKRIARIWGDILNMRNISINDNFFDIGGHSILMIQVHSELESEFGKKIEVVDLFRYPTIASLSAFINNNDTNNINDKAESRTEKMKNARSKRAGKREGKNE